jgi:flagellar basal-body rod modification protein FlgD
LAGGSTDPLANESTFLTLLVSQLQNQDPLNPTDSNQFVTQLTGYSQLEQLIGIHGNTTTLANDATGTSGTTPTTPTTGTGTTSSTTGN